MEIAVVGDDEFILGFMLAGITKYYNIEDGLENAFERAMVDQNVGILLTLDEHYKNLSDKMKIRCDMSNDPVVVVVGKTSDDTLREQIIKTVGVDLWKEGTKRPKDISKESPDLL